MKILKLVIVLGIVGGFLWLLVIGPMVSFRKNELTFKDAAKAYYEFYPSELPAGERIKTLSLDDLYKKGFIKKDLYIPYTRKVCSITNSWVKVRRIDNEYKYYTYLECGLLSSQIDHEGPKITLNDKDEIEIGIGSEYKDAGIKSLVDNKDGKMDIANVTVKSDVDTSKIGTYEVEYSAYDSLKNKSIKKRTIKVVQFIYDTIKNDLQEKTNYVGDVKNNYIRFSNMIFRIYGYDEHNNVILVSDEDIANVNYTKLDEWLEYFYDHLAKESKELIVKKKYCNMGVAEEDLELTKCKAFTQEREVYIPSVIEVNKAEPAKKYEKNFMRPFTVSWLANGKDKKKAYVTTQVFIDGFVGKRFGYLTKNSNYGVRPMITIKGDTQIKAGDGTEKKPYSFEEVPKVKLSSKLNERYSGEYVSIDGKIYRIIETEKDGTTKVISNESLYLAKKEILTVAYSKIGDRKNVIYNPKDKKSVGYFINNKSVSYLDTRFFKNHQITVPIYENEIVYKEEVETKKYNVLLSAPNMYEMFSTSPKNTHKSERYWYINSIKNKKTLAFVYREIPCVSQTNDKFKSGIRVVANIKDSVTISSGKGTYEDPYIIV